MTPDTHDGSQWDRVAAELRACRETQQRAWGDIDNTTLGRFLAGEVTSEEQQQIETALDALPELRKLTDLVRDVLGEVETAAAEPVSVPYGPMVLPFPQPQQRTSRPALAARQAEQTTPRQRKPWYREDRWRQRIGLVAAACLLLVLGFTLPRPMGSAMPEAGQSFAMSPPVADRTLPFDDNNVSLLEEGTKAKTSLLFLKGAAGVQRKREWGEQILVKRMDDSLQNLQEQGKKQEATALGSEFASNLTRQGLLYQRQGDLTRAEPALQEACRLCIQTVGPEAPQTIRTRNLLAGVYEVALNTASENPLPRSARDEKKSALAGQTAAPRVLALPPPASSAAVRSESSYAAPAASLSAQGTDRSRRGYKTIYGSSLRHLGAASSSQPSAMALCMCIRHRSPQEVKASIVPVLTQALREAKDAPERQRLARALSQLGSAASDAVPVLLGLCCRATDAAERATLLLALARIGPKELRQTLEPYLRHKDYEGGVQACLRVLPTSR